jgi:hypothetical protein
MEFNKDLIAASSTPMVLAILAEEDSYGYAILQRVRELSGGRMEWTDGMLYPVLERLGHVEARWETAASRRCTLVNLRQVASRLRERVSTLADAYWTPARRSR